MAAPRKPKPKPKAPAKPKPKATISFAQIGGALPPAPTAAEMRAERAKRQGAGNLYVPGSMRSKPAKPKRGGITGFKSRRRLLDEVMED